MKSCTDLEQSKKLAEILPIESADMRYGYIAPFEFSDRMYEGGYDEVPYLKDFMLKNPNFSEDEYDGEFPCWSLSALLKMLPLPTLEETMITTNVTKWQCTIYDEFHAKYWSELHNDAIDAVFEMVVWLKEIGKI